MDEFCNAYSLDTIWIQGDLLLHAKGVPSNILSKSNSMHGLEARNQSRGWLFGERGVFIINNIHRYMLYLAVIILSMKYYDVIHTMRFDGSWGFSLGTFVLALESFLLTMYVISCHAFRHLFGGSLDQWRGGISSVAGRIFRFSSRHNVSHNLWFWTSLAMVFIGDIFVLSVAEGIISDPSFIMG